MKEMFGYFIVYGLVFWVFPAVTCMFNSECKCRDAVKDMHLTTLVVIATIAVIGATVYLLTWCFT